MQTLQYSLPQIIRNQELKRQHDPDLCPRIATLRNEKVPESNHSVSGSVIFEAVGLSTTFFSSLIFELSHETLAQLMTADDSVSLSFACKRGVIESLAHEKRGCQRKVNTYAKDDEMEKRLPCRGKVSATEAESRMLMHQSSYFSRFFFVA